MKLHFTLFVGFVLGVTCSSSPNFHEVYKNSRLSAPVQELCDAYFDWRTTDMPQFATFIGIHDYDNRLDDMSIAAYYERFIQCQYFLTEADSLLPFLTNDADIVNIQVLKYELLTYIDSYSLNGFYLPMNYLEGIQVDMEKQFSWMIRNTTEDYEMMISRMQNLPLQVVQIINLMKAGIEAGLTYHTISMKNMNDSLGRFVVDDATLSPFYVFFANGTFPTSFSPILISDLQAQAVQAIMSYVTPAYEALRQYVLNDYVTRPDIAITSVPNGNEFYSNLIQFHTSTNLTAQQIQDIGYIEVDRIEVEMLKIIMEMGYDGMTNQEFSDMIRTDPNNYYETTDELFSSFENISYNIIPPKLSLVFKNLPTSPLLVVDDPDPNDPVAYYYAGAYDGSRPGVLLVNTYSTNATQKYRAMTLSIHEGNPGHHLQSSYAIESEDYPYFRRVMEDRNYGIAPSRFPIYSYYVEGWALYAERLGFEMDLYETPLDEYGHYSDEVFRACRLVVDTGIHALGWTRDQAIDYMFNHTASSRLDLENEVDRYITWPGQALAYKLGQLKITELRDKSIAILQDKFDLKEFHDVILRSLGPMNVVQSEIDKYIDETLSD